ncbi:DUF294 nucleotidyltransferase-like domain-containing protein [Thioclava sp. GXIMD4216]|uniref:DUF294 nucleotidyltransferase-like domain-containing protein n=1 Tax=Thioclava litoralis TaxID=3076557 RepID=A0ABZ1DYT2_9RHOB|nr:DUF294 nucleotidyltransferase-like domain-containing protein [Thioclava sp. FTW29]
MRDDLASVMTFLEGVHPYDTLPRNDLARVARSFDRRTLEAGAEIYRLGSVLDGLYLVQSGAVEVSDANGALVSVLGPRNSFGERGLMRDGQAATTARMREAGVLLLLPAAEFTRLCQSVDSFRRFFDRMPVRKARAGADLATMRVADLLSGKAVACRPETNVVEAARMMRDRHVSSLGVTDPQGRLLGIVTQRDMSNKVLAGNFPMSAEVGRVMTPDPVTLPPDALGSDILHRMLEKGIGHLPVTEHGRFIGMITQTDLTRFQAVSSASLIHEIARAQDVAGMAAITARIPQLLVQLVGAHHAHEVTTRLITDIADAVTRRLLAMAEAQLGPAPAPWVWAACGSQGRQEQTGVSDQDNCLIVGDTATEADMEYFRRFAQIVSDGLHACGYVYCPGDMMATNPRWCQRAEVWARYFRGWIATPNPEAQMLASVMFDLRVIGGTAPALFEALQAETLANAAKNSIFVAHMIANSLKHHPPLGLIRGFATIRSGEHRHQIDLKHNGVVPVADLGRVHALRGQLAVANTRARLLAACEAGTISVAGGQDLIAAYDLIAMTRLENQARQIRKGAAPDNYLAPSALPDFERSHLRDAFVVVRSLQSALGHGKASVS